MVFTGLVFVPYINVGSGSRKQTGGSLRVHWPNLIRPRDGRKGQSTRVRKQAHGNQVGHNASDPQMILNRSPAGPQRITKCFPNCSELFPNDTKWSPNGDHMIPKDCKTNHKYSPTDSQMIPTWYTCKYVHMYIPMYIHMHTWDSEAVEFRRF